MGRVINGHIECHGRESPPRGTIHVLLRQPDGRLGGNSQGCLIIGTNDKHGPGHLHAEHTLVQRCQHNQSNKTVINQSIIANFHLEYDILILMLYLIIHA
jgi:hypothetical protein